jgi:hypothetical protein
MELSSNLENVSNFLALSASLMMTRFSRSWASVVLLPAAHVNGTLPGVTHVPIDLTEIIPGLIPEFTYSVFLKWAVEKRLSPSRIIRTPRIVESFPHPLRCRLTAATLFVSRAVFIADITEPSLSRRSVRSSTWTTALFLVGPTASGNIALSSSNVPAVF